MRGPTRQGAALLAAAALALSACGEEEKFDAKGFVDAVQAEGVKLRLGEPLIASEKGEELYAIELEPVAELPGGEHGHAGGSLGVYADGDEANQELETCRASADLLCYRAANVVLVLEGGGIEAQQLGVAMERLGE